jgi:probable rRNA maturation factor
MSNFLIHTNIDGAYAVAEALLQQAAEQALITTQASDPHALTITITSAEKVQELNKQHAGLDYTTDVLSFPVEGEPYATEPGEPPYLGDIVIAYPVAETQAKEANVPVGTELQLLTVHGTLHLLGYDHDTPDRQAEMWALQSAAMDALRTSA